MQELTNIKQVRYLCEKYGFSLSKGFGQNFIVNPGICPKICDAADIRETDDVLEIGPGFGTLTTELVKRAGKVVSIEADQRLQPVLAETMEGYDNFSVVWADALKTDISALIKKEFGGSVKLCANLPYYITSPLLMKLLEETSGVETITVMVQREAAERITARPGTREAGAISYGISYYTTRQKLNFNVSPGSFYPPPKVQSSVITLAVNPNPPLAAEPEREKRLFKLVRAGFSQRRKTLVNGVSAGLGLEKSLISDALAKLNIKPAIRPEGLTLEQYIELERLIWQ